MNDSYDNDYNEFSSPKVEVKMGVKEAPVQQAVQREVPPPSRKQEKKDLTAIAPPKPGELGPAPTVDIPKLQNTVNDTLQNTGGPVAPAFHSPVDIQGTLNNALQSPYLIPGLIGAGLAGAALHAHLSSKKEDKIKSTAERDIKRLEPDMNVSQASSNGRIEPEFDWRTPPTNPKLQNLNDVLGGELQSHNDAKMVAQSENNKAMKEGKELPYPDLETKQEVAKEIAPDSGITAETSPQEADTLANVSEASKTPEEKVKTELEKGLTKEGAVIPEGRIPNYMEYKTKKGGTKEYKNKQGSDVIGKGGWNWYQGQMGPEAEENWLHQFGRTNQTYKDVTQAVKEGRLKGPEVTSEGKGGTFSREPHVPNYIKGAASLGEMAAMAGLPLGALGLYHAYQHGKETGDYTDLGMGGVDLASSALGRAAIPLAFATHMENAGAPVLPPRILEAQRQAKLLGSPYRNAK